MADEERRDALFLKLGSWPRCLIPRYWLTWLQMQVWTPSAHVLFVIHVIGEGETSRSRAARIRTPLAWLLPHSVIERYMRFVPHALRYMGAARVEMRDGGRKRYVYVHVVGLPWNTTELTKKEHSLYETAVADMNQTIIYMLRDVVPEASVVALGAATAIPNTFGTKLPAILAAAGFPKVTVTNGNSNTGGAAGANLIWFHNQWMEVSADRQGKKWKVAIVGAGSVGSGLARVLMKRDDLCSELLLVGRNRGDRKVSKLIDELSRGYPSGPSVEERDLEEVVQEADVVVFCTNSATPLTFAKKPRKGMLFLDVAKPANVPRELCADPDYLAVSGSIVTLPGRGRGFGLSIGLKGYLCFACGAEAVLLAAYKKSEDRWNWLTRGFKPEDIPTLFVGQPKDAVMQRLGIISDHLGIRPSDQWLDPHTNLPYSEDRVRAFLEMLEVSRE
ncbi:MAG TPA: NAD(P)-binding domain-containing protein [Verrucomicrobiae bacterium]|nr:NAD(P)-binding domain-containing protein [Verrucomicrobiae bacterium]